ncbi:MAG: PQQ-binding-like beta-propeller repeat protein [Pirellulales bacterium]
MRRDSATNRLLALAVCLALAPKFVLSQELGSAVAHPRSAATAEMSANPAEPSTPLTVTPVTIRPTLIDGATAQQLTQLLTLIDAQRIDEASEIASMLLNDHGDKLVSVADPASGFTRLIPLRQRLYDLLVSYSRDPVSAQFQRDLIRRLGQRNEDPLRSRLITATTIADLRTLRDLAILYPVSDIATQAQLTLGDLAWGDGRLDSAEHWWRMAELRLAERAELEKAAASVPDRTPRQMDSSAVSESPTAVDLAGRHVLLDIARHDLPTAKAKVQQLLTRNPDATSKLWGRPQRWSDVLAPLLTLTSDSAAARLSFPNSVAHDMVTAGSSGVDDWRPGQLRILWSATWEHLEAGQTSSTAMAAAHDPSPDHVPTTEAAEREDRRTTERRDIPRPLVWRETLLVPDIEGFTAFELATGHREYDVHPLAGPATDAGKSSAGGEPGEGGEGRPQLLPAAIDGDRLGMVIEPNGNDGQRTRSMAIVCELASEGRLICVCEPPATELEFSSGPVLDGESVWLVTRSRSGASDWGLARYESDSGRLVWHTLFPPSGGAADHASNDTAPVSLSLAGNWLIVATAQGQIAAVDTATGMLMWSLRDMAPVSSPRRLDGQPWFRWRSLTAPYRAEGRLIFALPSRSDLLALNETTGAVSWETQVPASDFDALEIVGRVGDTLIATGHRVWLIDFTSGQLLHPGIDNPFPTETTAVVAGGPGYLAGRYLLWTARHRDGSDWFYSWNIRRGLWAVPPYPLQLPGIGLSRLQPCDRFWLAIHAAGVTVLSPH